MQLLLLPLLLVFVASVQARRVLVVLDSASHREQYSQLIGALNTTTLLTVCAANDDSFPLFRFSEPQFDAVFLLSPKAKAYANGISTAALIDFTNAGGNIVVAASAQVSQIIQDFALEYSVDYDPSPVFDNFHSINSTSNILLSSQNFPSFLKGTGGVYKGIPHRVSKRNPLVSALAVGSATTYSWDTNGIVDQNAFCVGVTCALITAHQSRNNARTLFTGSVEMFNDGNYAQNADLIDSLTKWTLQDSHVLTVSSFIHHRQNETHQHGIYRIKDTLTLELEISLKSSDSLQPFIASDIQVEAVMLDPYIIKTMSLLKTTPTSAVYTADIQLPDKHGVYTLKVDYKRYGYSWIEVKDVVEVRPFRHTDYPRFLSAAWPYYVNVFVGMIGWVVISAVWIGFKEEKKRKE